MTIILWDRGRQNVVVSSQNQAMKFRDATEANLDLNNNGLLGRLTQEAIAAGYAAPVIDQITVS
jgi:hypothetical protein